MSMDLDNRFQNIPFEQISAIRYTLQKFEFNMPFKKHFKKYKTRYITSLLVIGWLIYELTKSSRNSDIYLKDRTSREKKIIKPIIEEQQKLFSKNCMHRKFRIINVFEDTFLRESGMSDIRQFIQPYSYGLIIKKSFWKYFHKTHTLYDINSAVYDWFLASEQETTFKDMEKIGKISIFAERRKILSSDKQSQYLEFLRQIGKFSIVDQTEHGTASEIRDIVLCEDTNTLIFVSCSKTMSDADFLRFVKTDTEDDFGIQSFYKNAE